MDVQPYQQLIDTVSDMGGVTMWTQVESTDDHPFSWGKVHTDPHPQVLHETVGYDGFGAIYPEQHRAQEPGREWDQALLAYLSGQRSRAPFGWGELALHYPEQIDDKAIDEVVTILRAPDRSAESLLGALADGHGYAVRSAHADGRLRLDRWDITSGGTSARSGEWIEAEGVITVRVDWSYTGTDLPEIRLRLVRNGEVVAERGGRPPGSLALQASAPRPGESVYYRLELSGRDKLLLSNPIFVRSVGETP
jgi:hypothetical protein